MSSNLQLHNPVGALQIGIKARLTTAMASVPVVDYRPEDGAFPFIRMGEFQARCTRTAGCELWEVVWTPHVFSTFDGQEQVQGIHDSLVQALTSTSAGVTATGWTVGGPRVESLEANEEEEDGLTYWHGTPVFRFYLRK